MTLCNPLVTTLERLGDLAVTLTNLKGGSLLFIGDLHRLSNTSCEILAHASRASGLPGVGPRPEDDNY